MDFDLTPSFDCDFLGEEDFGLASCFSKQSQFQVAPCRDFSNTAVQEEPTADPELNSEIRADGFCFKLAPSGDQVQFQRQLKDMAPKMTDFSKGTTTLAFEFKEGVLVAVDARAT